MHHIYVVITLGVLSLAAQQARKEGTAIPRSEPSRLERGLVMREDTANTTPVPGKALAVPSLSVLIEGTALDIPDPPVDARMAKARLKEVKARALESMDFLDTQLNLFYEEQKRQLEEAKALPRTHEEGLGSPLHEELWALVRDTSLKVGEEGLVKSMQAQMELQKVRGERDAHLLDTQSGLRQSAESTHTFNPQQEDREGRGPIRLALTWQGDVFLKGYRPAWEGYAPKLEAYIQTSARLLLELESKPQIPSTQLLGRLLKLQLFERCRALIALNAEIWNLSAAKVLEPRQFHLAQETGLMVVSPGGKELRFLR